jgi:hypothetical protein
MSVFLFLYFLNIIYYSLNQDSSYCDLDHYCDSCTFCGEDTNDYCSCNFYNSYCIISETNKADFSTDFILNYDGCLTNNENVDICGSSVVSVSNGQTKTINFQSTSESDFVCYYSIKGSSNSNKMVITIKNAGSQQQDFDLYIITYEQNASPTVTMLSNSYVTSSFEITKSNIGKISIYFDVGEGSNLDKISLSFLYNESNDGTTTVSTTKSSGGSNTGLIIGIIVGIVALIIIIIVSIILYKKCKRKKRKDKNTNNNLTLDNTTLNPQYMSVVNSNKEKLDLMFKNELIPSIYNKNNVINDCYNCTICMENFIDNSSIIVTTKCNHSFHEKCFKNWVFKNIICPKCPNCNYLFLGPQDSNLQNITMPSNLDFTVQTNTIGATTNLGVTH